jgi:hypothetical protein
MTGAGAMKTGGGGTKITGAGTAMTGSGKPKPMLKKKFVFAIDVVGTRKRRNRIANKKNLFISNASKGDNCIDIN